MTITQIMEMAKETILTTGQHLPMLIVEHGEKQLHLLVIDSLPESTQAKQTLFFRIGHMLVKEQQIEHIREASFITEAWASKVDNPDAPRGWARPADDPHRSEVLIVLKLELSGKQAKQTVQMVEMIRHGDTLDLSPVEEVSEVRSMLLPSLLAGVIAAQMPDQEMRKLVKNFKRTTGR